MTKLDLHGSKHEDVERLVDSFIYNNGHKTPLTIVTGHSRTMQDLVIETITSCGYNYQVGDGINNMGVIIVT